MEIIDIAFKVVFFGAVVFGLYSFCKFVIKYVNNLTDKRDENI